MKVFYMNGAGNDFMVFDARGLQMNFAETAKKLCALRHADGLLAVGDAEDADFEMIFYNSDGTRGEMCGNGARCIARFAYHIGAAGEHMVFRTLAGPVEGWRVSESLYRVALNTPSVLDLNRKGDTAYVELGNPGVPHAVRQCEKDLFACKASLREQMRALRFDPAFPKGANVNYYRLTGPGEADVLTFERGVEDFTLACGTGCGSVTCVLWALGELPGKHLITEVRGGKLEYHIQGSDHVKELIMDGPTEILKIYEV